MDLKATFFLHSSSISDMDTVRSELQGLLKYFSDWTEVVVVVVAMLGVLENTLEG